ncbi:hypothetical protein C357_13702 [Citreicella sp. 357]|nr:hypothetical protein C357_13702 [Citreicella sp. 357]
MMGPVLLGGILGQRAGGGNSAWVRSGIIPA